MQACVFFGLLGLCQAGGGFGGIKDVSLNSTSEENQHIYEIADWAAGQMCAEDDLDLYCPDGVKFMELTHASTQVTTAEIQYLI